MPFNVAPVDTLPTPIKPVWSPSELLSAFGALFPATEVRERVRGTHLWWLLIIVTAGAVVRFWGLGTVGLHGDEETMGLAVRGILDQGAPILPSGMFYPRGLTQLYLMSLSVWTWGESEWALRLPSAICGVVLIGVVFFLGRRFLRPQWCVVLAAVVAFLPELIVYSQTARMYIFLITAIAIGMTCLFSWERTGRTGWLLGAVAALTLGLDMHALAVAAVPMFLLPGITRRDISKLLWGVVAGLAVALAFFFIEGLVGSQYPVPPQDIVSQWGGAPLEGPSIAHDRLPVPILFALSGVAAGVLALWVVRAMTGLPVAVAAAVPMAAGICLQLALEYHLASIAYVTAFVLVWRFGTVAAKRRTLVLLFGLLAMAACHAIALAPGSGTLTRLIGAMVGRISIWPYARLMDFSVVAGMCFYGLLGWGLVRLAKRSPASDYWLLAVLAVWAPAVAVGFFAWNVPARYLAMTLIPFLVCTLAFAQALVDKLASTWWQDSASGSWRKTATAALVGVGSINPAAALSSLDSGYSNHPDHKGAAEFVRAQELTAEDLVLAEDVLQQTYYLGKVDYWLVGPAVARNFVTKAGDDVVDFYTGTPVVVNESMLDAVLDANPSKRIFIIGSGEEQVDGRLYARGAEIQKALRSSRVQSVYLGRDGLTRVWRVVPRAAVVDSERVTLHDSNAEATDELSAAPAPSSQIRPSE